MPELYHGNISGLRVLKNRILIKVTNNDPLPKLYIVILILIMSQCVDYMAIVNYCSILIPLMSQYADYMSIVK